MRKCFIYNTMYYMKHSAKAAKTVRPVVTKAKKSQRKISASVAGRAARKRLASALETILNRTKLNDATEPQKRKIKANGSAQKSKSAKVQPQELSEKSKIARAVSAEKIKSVKAKPSAAAKKVKAATAKTVSPAKAKNVKAQLLKAAKSLAKKTVPAKRQNVGVAEKSVVAKRKVSAVKVNSAKRAATVSIKKKAVSVEKNKSETKKLKTAPSVKTVKVKSVKTRAPANKTPKAKISRLVAASKDAKRKTKISPKKIEAIKPKSAEKIRRAPKVKNAERGNGKSFAPIENKIEAPSVQIVQKPKKKKAKAISSAVFRGKKERYDFQVFPLDALFEQTATPAVYVISKRKTDRNKRAHHALLCIGQTDSVSVEIKRHQKNCIKKHAANVISLLPETNEKKRLKIEEDLKAAHSLACGIS